MLQALIHKRAIRNCLLIVSAHPRIFYSSPCLTTRAHSSSEKLATQVLEHTQVASTSPSLHPRSCHTYSSRREGYVRQDRGCNSSTSDGHLRWCAAEAHGTSLTGGEENCGGTRRIIGLWEPLDLIQPVKSFFRSRNRVFNLHMFDCTCVLGKTVLSAHMRRTPFRHASHARP
jgi:hypothetical protein